MPLPEGSPATVLTGTTLQSFALDGDLVYLSDAGAIERQALQGGSPTVLVPKAANAAGLIVDAGHIYWFDRVANRILRKTK